jgi:uncharacterized membrane protein YagU involved in acid resistance
MKATTLLRAGLLTGVSDGFFSSILSIAFYHSTATRLFQGVAATLVGRAAFDGGLPVALLGVLMHFGVAFAWSATFLVLASRVPAVRRAISSRGGVMGVAALYGPFIWMVMSLAVIPLLTRRPPAIGFRWWVQFFGHIPFVGVPIVASIAAGSARARAPRELPAAEA